MTEGSRRYRSTVTVLILNTTLICERHKNTPNLHMRENEGELEKLILRKKQVQKAWKISFRSSVTGLILKYKNGKSCPEASAEGITKYKR